MRIILIKSRNARAPITANADPCNLEEHRKVSISTEGVKSREIVPDRILEITILLVRFFFVRHQDIRQNFELL
jgi:hypothetical protein